MDWLFQIEAIKAEIPLARLRLGVISHPSDRDQEAVFDQKGHVTSCPAALLHCCLASILGYTLKQAATQREDITNSPGCCTSHSLTFPL